MLEAFCRNNVWEQCKKVTGDEPLVHLKGKPVEPWKYKGFYETFSRFTVYNGNLAKMIMKEPTNSPRRKAVGLFSRNGEKIFQGLIDERYNGDWEKAILTAKTFGNLWNEFEEYFAERKKKFMEKTDDIIAKMPKQLTRDGKIRTNSHGGVANLLKVLTKTMYEQGSSIRTIAKVQYAISYKLGYMFQMILSMMS